MITGENLHMHEMIGLHTELISSTNAQIVGLHGMIIDETKNMFVIDSGDHTRHVPKDIGMWRFALPGGRVDLDGMRLAKRPFERMSR